MGSGEGEAFSISFMSCLHPAQGEGKGEEGGGGERKIRSSSERDRKREMFLCKEEESPGREERALEVL